MPGIADEIRSELFAMRDENYKNFHAKLIPTVNPELIIGVRTPELRRYAKALAKTPRGAEFIKLLPHKYYDENNLHAFILEEIKDFEIVLSETERFLPYIDNWATCDMFLPKAFRRNAERLLTKIGEWAASGRTYTVRYAVGLLMSFFLDSGFKREYLELAASAAGDEYYVNMMIAWYFATALAKQYSDAVVWIEEKRLPVWIHNKTIQKAVESSRIPPETKAYLRQCRTKTT